MRGVLLPLLVTLVIQALASLVVFTPPVLAPIAHEDFGVAASNVGITTALIYASAAFAALLSSQAIAWLGAMRVSQLCLLLVASGLSLMTTANLWLGVLGALIIGVGYGPMTPSSSTILADRAPPHLRAFIFSVKQTGVTLGGALSGFLVPLLMIAFGWKWAAVLVALACVVFAILVEPFRYSVDGDSHRTAAPPLNILAPLKLVLADHHLRILALASLTYSGMQMCLGSYLVVFLHDKVGFGVATAGFALSTAMIFGTLGRLFWGWVADQWGNPNRLLGLLGVAMSVAAFAMAGVTGQWPLTTVFVLSAAYGATAVGWNGVYLSEVARIAPAGSAGAATGASLFMTYAGVVALPSLYWAIVTLMGSYSLAFVAVGALTLWRGLCVFRLKARTIQ
jgi:MFS family permease